MYAEEIVLEKETPFLSEEDEEIAMAALLLFIRSERMLRPVAIDIYKRHPVLFEKQIAGIRAELGNPKWRSPEFDRLTLSPLLRIITPHLGTNAALQVLPYYRKEYNHLEALRNSIAHGEWERLIALGGPASAYEWAFKFRDLVRICTSKRDDMFILHAHLLMGNTEWPWPTEGIPKITG
jgi:hypothetical protein